MNFTVNMVYLFLLIFTVGASFVVAIIDAPIIFNANDYIEQYISKSESGKIMTQIFIKFSYILTSVATISLVVELREYIYHRRDMTVLVSSYIFVFSAFLFSLYYTPYIEEAQRDGIVDITAFENMHKSAEVDFKIFFIALIVLSLRRLYLLKKL